MKKVEFTALLTADLVILFYSLDVDVILGYLFINANKMYIIFIKLYESSFCVSSKCLININTIPTQYSGLHVVFVISFYR